MSRPPLAFPPAWVELRQLGFSDRACGRCGWRFFTTAGLWDHQQECEQLAAVERRVLALRQTGLAVTALNNARRIRCHGCELVATPGPITVHQRATGHTGRTELT